MNNLPNRRTVRLAQHYYSMSGGYFITICTHNKKCIFGSIRNNKAVLNSTGQIVEEELVASSSLRKEVEIEKYVIMPNHLHAIIRITAKQPPPAVIRGEVAGARRAPLQVEPDNSREKKSLSSFVAGFKSSATRRIRENMRNPIFEVWQRNYYEHIIRNEEDYQSIIEYIINNPINWETDEHYIK